MLAFISFLGEKRFELKEGHGAFQGRNVITVILVISRWSNKLSPYQKGFEIKDSGPMVSILHVLER